MKQATALVDYGIHTEESDIRAHVCAQVGVVGITAEGWLVKKQWIKDLREVYFNWRWWTHYSETFSTTRKGKFAVACVRDCMRAGYFPLWFDGIEEESLEVQVAGTDLLVFCNKRVQVKCDYPIAQTGNLFLQKSECNPLNNY